MLADDSGAIFAESTGSVSPRGAWNDAGDVAFEVFALKSVRVGTGFARSGDRTSLLPRVQLTEGSDAGPGGGWRGGPGPDPSVAVAAATFARCVRIFVMTLLSVMTATIAPHAREERIDLVDAADQLGPPLPEQLAFAATDGTRGSSSVRDISAAGWSPTPAPASGRQDSIS